MYNNNIIKKVTLILIMLVVSCFGQLVFEENFNYTANDPLTNYGWTAHSGAGTNSIRIFSPGLSYAGYAGSGIGNAARVDTAGEDVNKTFTTSITSGTVYTAFMMYLQKATTTGDYFFHLSTSPLTTYEFVSRFHIKRNAAGAVALGLGKRHSDTTFTDFNYALTTIYLVVIKYEIISGDSNDRLSLFVFSSGVPSTEPTTPTLGPLTPGNYDPPHFGSVALRQGSGASAPRVVIDGIRVATSWSGAVSGIEENNLLSPTANYLNFTINPNPFRDFTTISFNLNPKTVDKIVIYDIAGKAIQTINRPTTNQVIWNGRNSNGELITSGIYFIVLETNTGNKVAKVLLSK